MFGFGAILTVVAVIGLIAWWRWQRRRRPDPSALRAEFARLRSTLERAFFEKASASGKPRGLRWKSCEWGDDLILFRDRRSRQWLALSPVTIAFEAIPGSDMEGLPAVGNLRCGWGIFVWQQGWHATGQTLLNLGADQLRREFAGRYELYDLSLTPGGA